MKYSQLRLSTLILFVLCFSVLLGALSYTYREKPTVFRGNGIDADKKLVINGPYVLQAPARPVIVFLTRSGKLLGSVKDIPFVVFIYCDNESTLSVVEDSYVHQFVNIVTDINLKIGKTDLKIEYLNTVYSFETSSNDIGENLEFWFGGDREPRFFELDSGRVFEIDLRKNKKLIKQHSYEVFSARDFENMRDLPDTTIANWVFAWLNGIEQQIKKDGESSSAVPKS